MKYSGLTSAQVDESRRTNGINVLTPPAQTPLWLRFLRYFGDPLIVILLVAGVLSVGISIYEYTSIPDKGMEAFFEPIGIFVAIFLSTGMSFYFENKANKEFSLLNKVNDDEMVTVIRDNNVCLVARKDVVVGDIVLLQTGQEVPADAELLDSTSLLLDESSLTGEPSCRKTALESEFDSEATFPSNHVMRGTKVMEGHGVCRVFAVGDATENGKVFTAAQIDDGVKTPLDEQLDRLGVMVARFSYVVGILIVVGRILHYSLTDTLELDVYFFAYVLQSLMIAVTLVVVSVPEGLPMAVTMSLAYSMRRMLRTNNLVRKLHACETMGAITVICTDKTGTLTQNRMQVTDTDIIASDLRLIQENMALCSTASLDFSDDATSDRPSVIGNPTEGALLLWLHADGVDYRELRQSMKVLVEIPFNTERKYMAVVVRSCALDRPVVYVKGAPEIVLDMCSQTMDASSRTLIEAHLSELQHAAKRTLGFATMVLEWSEDDLVREGERLVQDAMAAGKLTYMGIVGIADPVRPDVPPAVGECYGAGIKVKIVTGDTPATALEIGRQIGVDVSDTDDKSIITGPEFAALSDEELLSRVLDIRIIARARPMDKKRLVEALQKCGQVVAVTGDGTNDAPALKAAHVGLSMGDGTSVAKEASDITIIDNSFSSITRAVMWGRSLYQNIQRFILFQLTVNVVACLIVLFGAFLDQESPLTVTQMLWVNLIMDTFAAMALSILPPNESVMHKNPRNRRAFIITRHMWGSILGVGFAFTILSVALLLAFERYDMHQALDLLTPSAYVVGGDGLSGYELTLFFTLFVFLQLWNLFNARVYATGQSIFRLWRSGRSFWAIVASIFVGQILIVEFGGGLFNVVDGGLSLMDWLLVFVLTSPVLFIGEVLRLLFVRKR